MLGAFRRRDVLQLGSQHVQLLTQDNPVSLNLQDPRVKAANPFLQGNSRGWAMVEFWTKDKALVDNAAAVLFDLFKLPVFEGQFTREDLGLA